MSTSAAELSDGETASTRAATVRIRRPDYHATAPKTQRPTMRTALAELERSLFDAFEYAQVAQFER